MKVYFENYSYYPALRTRSAEMTGLNNLSYENKKKNITFNFFGEMASLGRNTGIVR